MKPSLTPKQLQVLEAIKSSLLRIAQPPTQDELRVALKLKSLRSVVQYLETLERKGYITRRKNLARNIELTNADWDGLPNRTISIPVVASVGCDDLSVFANATDHCDEFLEVDKNVVESAGEIVAVRASGNSMSDANINSGDYILVQFTDHAEHGDRIAVVINGMVTVKRFERQGNMILLRPESKDPKYKPIVVSGDFKIIGKVLCVIPSPTAEYSEVVPLTQTYDAFR